ncbi:MAG: GNAT family N-acetyltransferase [Erythrobacter sp.]|uniref:GNAT family N-acetyltransferase n=1 Tax=Erythrobacter sp. TaxID=1042 RepID=UPI002616B8E5|nr:GNAT family N-acetyltransferase [Erythrobacter sp.]MDJ0979027.1 GNAT family N-acetyltransferase [Erythrobacter sp.]
MSAQVPSSLVKNRASIDFTIGARRLASVERDLATWSFTLAQALSEPSQRIEPPSPGRDGWRVLSAPTAHIPSILERFPDHIVGARQDYPRRFVAMDGSFDDYLARFSSKTRSTLRRKARKLEGEVGASFAISEHRSPAQIERFLARALPLSARTYQARLLNAGLPEDQAAQSEMLALAEADRIRCFLLEGPDAPIAYLALPVRGTTLIYAHLGYDPHWARFSPGTVLQMEALERLFAEQRFSHFDFTEGDGAHKALFATDSVCCASFALLSPTLANRALAAGRDAFDASVGAAKAFAQRSGGLARLRARLRA